jgi:hypothetical protein
MFAPYAEFEFPSGMQTLGLGGPFRGHEGRIDAIEKMFEVWASELELAYIFDLGDRLLNLGFGLNRARASEVQLKGEAAQLVTLRDGLITRDQIFFSWKEGLRAAGFDPDAVSFPKRGETEQVASTSS